MRASRCASSPASLPARHRSPRCRSGSGTIPDGEKYRAAYFSKVPGVWCHGDRAELTRHDGIIIYGRSDATLNPGGVRIGTAEIYRQVEQLPEVLESVAVGQHWQDDERIVLFVRLRNRARTGRCVARTHPQADPRQHHATPRAGEDPASRRHSAHHLRQDFRTRGACRDPRRGPVKNTDALANAKALDAYRALADTLR